MFRTMLKSKIHRAVITEANLNYVGSITIDEELMDAVDLLPNEKVAVVDINNGARFETYVITGERGSGVICVNGAAARLVQPGDHIIILAYAMMEDARARAHQPRIAIVNDQNEIVDLVGEELHAETWDPAP